MESKQSEACKQRANRRCTEVFNRISNRKDHDSDAHFEALENEDLCEVRAIVATQPAGVTGTPSKVPSW